MTKTITNSRNSTLDSLLNTLRNFWELLRHRNVRWREVRSEAIAEQRFYKKKRSWDRETRRDWDIAHERVTLGDGMCTVEALVNDLIVSLEGNPFPGEQHTVLHVAVTLFPSAKVMLEPKVFVSGEKLWVRIFQGGKVSYWEKVYFPVVSQELDIAKLEELLWGLVREDNTIVAAEVPKALQMEANGKAYRTVKSKLEERNWIWSARREGGKLVKIVTAPSKGETALHLGI